MLRRIRALLAARFQASPDGGLPWAGIVMQVLVAGVLCGVASDVVGPFGYALFALGVSGMLLAVPLFGEAGQLLYADEARAWIESLPARPAEVQIARRLHALSTLLLLSLGSLLPAAVLAPEALGLGGRLLLVVCGLGQAVTLAAILLAILALAGGRADALLVGLQTLIFMGLFVGGVLGLRYVTALADFGQFADLPATARQMLPPAWFASPITDSGPTWGLPATGAVATSIAALFVLALAPAPANALESTGRSLVTLLSAPLRRLALAVWVRPDERATFGLVCDALPREREFVLRTYPLIGLPLALLFVGARDVAGPEREALLALFLFTPGAYLPLLLTQLPASRSHAARWLLDTAPIPDEALHAGAFKALVVRFVLPLYVALTFICCALAPDVALRLALPAALFAVIAARLAYPVAAGDLPLSRSPDELGAGNHVFGAMIAIGLIGTVAAVAATKLVTGGVATAVVTAALIAVEILLDRRRATVPVAA